MFKLNIQLFGTPAKSAKGILIIGDLAYLHIGNNRYTFPSRLFNGVKEGSKDSDELIKALVFAAFEFEHGENVLAYNNKNAVLQGVDGDEALVNFLIKEAQDKGYDTTSIEAYIEKGKEFHEPWYSTTKVRRKTDKEISEEVQRWYAAMSLQEFAKSLGANQEQLDLLDTMKYDKSSIIQDMIKDNSSYQKNIASAKMSGQMEKADTNGNNGVLYRDYEPAQKAASGLGKPIAKDEEGNFYYDLNGVTVNSDGQPITEDVTPIKLPDAEKPPVKNPDINYEDLLDGYIDTKNKNTYYDDLYSLRDGTLGQQILSSNTRLAETESRNALLASQTAQQTQGLAQAQTIKQITDSIRAERMAQLRAGMSEAQLAEREIQMLMAGNKQMVDASYQANQGEFEARLAGETARDQAFQQYIEQTTALGQNAAAQYAAHVGDINTQAEVYRQRVFAETGRMPSYTEAVQQMGGSLPKVPTKDDI